MFGGPRPLPPPEGPMTPPSSPRRRRELQRSSDEASGVMTIEQFLYRSDLFRCTSAGTQYPLPIARSPTALNQHVVQRLNKLLPTIRGIVETYLKEAVTINIVDSWKPDYPGGQYRKPTVLIEVYNGTGSPSSWPKIRDQVQGLLHDSQFYAIDVEIIDNDRAFMPSIFAQDPKTGSIMIYEMARGQIVDLLFKALRDDWLCLSLFKFGRTRADSKPAIVVYVRPQASCDWILLSETIQSTFASKLPPNRNLDVKFLPGILSTPVGKDVKDSGLTNEFPLNIHMGSSLGSSESPYSGTLGGFMNLQIGHQIHQGFMTNHHVIRRRLPHNPNDSFPYLPKIDQKRLIVQLPSNEDLSASRNGLQKKIKFQKKVASDSRSEQEERMVAGAGVPPRLEILYQEQLQLAAQNEKVLSYFNHYPIQLGRPLISSGNAINAKLNIVDWAFIEFDPSLVQALKHGPLLNHLPKTVSKSTVQDEGEEVIFSLPPIATLFGKMVKGHWYYKWGRTSDITIGKCNGTEVEINREGFRYDDDDGRPIQLTGPHSTREYVILGVTKDSNGRVTQTAFSEPGDSGSFVINTLGEVCGLMYGEHSGLCGSRMDIGVGLVTCMQDIQSSLASRTTFHDRKGNEYVGKFVLPGAENED